MTLPRRSAAEPAPAAVSPGTRWGARNPRMRSFIVTAAQARKLPRWGLLLLCVLYVVPGLIGRDPWRTEDAIGFGIAHAMLEGGPGSWLVPTVTGVPVFDWGPLPFGMAAALASLTRPWLLPHVAIYIAAMLGLATMLAFVWRATYLLARRPGVLPPDPLGVGASTTDFARAVADSGLLITLATFGLVTRMHETTAAAAQVVWVGAFLFGAARTLDLPVRGVVVCALAIGASVATRGLVTAAGLLAALALLPLLSQPYRLVARQIYGIGLPLAIALALAWPLALWLDGGADTRAYLTGWLAAQRASLGLPGEASVIYAARYVPWFYWPAWPLAAWAVWRWRGRWNQPAVALPATIAAVQLLLALCVNQPGEAWLLPATLPIAVLAAMGLPTLKRAVVSLIDWFAVMLFSLMGIAIWAYWFAFVTGFPPRMAGSASRLAPGFLPQWDALDIGLALAASLAWLLLVQWRIARHPPVIWRAVVLSAGGLCLAWFLLMTLWLPVFNERNTYRNIGERVGTFVSDRSACVEARRVGAAERATIAYFAPLRWGAPGERCEYLLVQDLGARAWVSETREEGWRELWQGKRRPTADERFRLYERDTG